MNALVLLAGVLAVLPQARGPSARELLNAPRPLTGSEIATVLSRSQDAVAGKTLSFRLNSRTHVGPQTYMGPRGRPRRVRWAGATSGGIVGGVIGPDGKSVPFRTVRWRREYIKIIEFTGRPAVYCDGEPAEGELVIEYETTLPSKHWTAVARQRTPNELGVDMTAMFDMLQGSGTITSGDRRRIEGRWARALVSTYSPRYPALTEEAPLIGDPIPNVKGEPIVRQGLQTLWLDVRSLRPLRWEVSPGNASSYAFDFKYGGRAPRAPSGVAAPECV